MKDKECRGKWYTDHERCRNPREEDCQRRNEVKSRRDVSGGYNLEG